MIPALVEVVRNIRSVAVDKTYIFLYRILRIIQTDPLPKIQPPFPAPKNAKDMT